MDGEDNLFHGPRSLPPTLEEFTASLRSDLQELKNAISMPAKTRPWQTTIEFVDGLKEKFPDEEPTVVKRYVEKRSREAAQAHVTVTPVDTVQYCSPSPQTPEPSPKACYKLENNEGRMDPERGELEPPSAGTGLERPDSSVLRTRGRGRKDESSLRVICSLAWVRQQLQTSFSCSRVTNPKTRRKTAKKISNLTPVEKKRRHRFGTRL